MERLIATVDEHRPWPIMHNDQHDDPVIYMSVESQVQIELTQATTGCPPRRSSWKYAVVPVGFKMGEIPHLVVWCDIRCLTEST